MRYGGTPSGPGDLRRDALARDRSSVTVGGGRSSKRGWALTQSSAQLDSVQVCAFRKVLGRHLMCLGVVASRLRGFVPDPSILLLYRYPRKASLSRPLFGPKSSSRRLNQNQDPSKGQF